MLMKDYFILTNLPIKYYYIQSLRDLYLYYVYSE